MISLSTATIETGLYEHLRHWLCHHLPQEVPLVLTPCLSPDEPMARDFSTPIAFALAKVYKKSPLALAQELAQKLQKELKNAPLKDADDPQDHMSYWIQDISHEKGYINISLRPCVWENSIKTVLREGGTYGYRSKGSGEKVNVEYVSANPTGPLHAAHARGAILGDAIANLLESQGHEVTREYYINDAGKQVEILVDTMTHHCCALEKGHDAAEISEGMYPGSYVVDMARAFMQHRLQNHRHSHDHPCAESSWRETSFQERATFALQWVMDMIRQDLRDLNIAHDVFTSERALHEEGILDQVLERLEICHAVYTGTLAPPKTKGAEEKEASSISMISSEPLLLFRSCQWGDDQDRPLKRSDGSWTYFAGDIAYHWDKIRRGYTTMIDVWGADHASHVQRLQGAIKALLGHRPFDLSQDPIPQEEATQDLKNPELSILLCQMVHFLKDGQSLKFSKRSGNVLSIPDVLSMVGLDVLRFMVLTKKADTHLDLDIDLMNMESRENPVFYVQYAHARGCSVLRAAKEHFSAESLSPSALRQAHLHLLPSDALHGLARIVAHWPQILKDAAVKREPHLITHYLTLLAQSFHALWTQGQKNLAYRFLSADDKDRSYAYLALISACVSTMALGLKVLGIQAKEELRYDQSTAPGEENSSSPRT